MKQVRRNRLVLVSLLIVLVVTLTPGSGKVVDNHLDKVVHFLILFILSINLCYKYQQTERLTDVLLGAVLLGLLTEVLQQYIPGRGLDFYDGLADTLGVIGGYYSYRSKPLLFDQVIIKLGG